MVKNGKKKYGLKILLKNVPLISLPVLPHFPTYVMLIMTPYPCYYLYHTCVKGQV